MLEKDLKHYVHLYLGCNVLVPKEQYWHDAAAKRKFLYDGIEQLQSISYETVTVSWPEEGFMILYHDDIKLVLRPLSDMKEEEDTELCAFCLVSDLEHKEKWDALLMSEAKRTTYLLSKHFDLFGLIDAGLAIDKTKIY